MVTQDRQARSRPKSVQFSTATSVQFYTVGNSCVPSPRASRARSQTSAAAVSVSIHSGEYLGPGRLALARTKGGKVRPAGAGWARSPRSGSSLRRWASVVGKLASWPQRGVKLRAGQCCRVRERVLPLAARWPESSSVWEVRGVPPCAARPSLTGAMGTGPMGPGPGCAHRHPANPAGTGTGSAQPLSLSAAR